ncbi:MAG: hypothetical protein MUC76_00185 [Spirochaetes bacterium]|jgi:hypothetical protein|nr:hypothetical protein [Spirochaetota bacterium]
MKNTETPQTANPGLWLVIAASSGALFITGSFFSIDWINYLYGTNSVYPAFAKPAVSLLCALIVFGIGRNGLGSRDTLLLVVSYICIVIVDAAMSVWVYHDDASLKNAAFLIGAALSIIAHVLLIIRHARGFHFLRSGSTFARRAAFPLCFYVPVAVIFMFLAAPLHAAGQFYPSLFYALILTTSLWVGWETVRNHLFPARNAWLIAMGVSSWFATEIIGVLYNIRVESIAPICMIMTWLFYMPAILLIALSGHRWGTRG